MTRSLGRDRDPRPVVFVTGPFPPPVHGMAVATALLAARLGARFDVRRFDIAATAHSGVAALDLLLRMILATVTLARYSFSLLHRRPRCVVVALSAGFAKLFDLIAIAIALTFGRTVYVTHHSFAVIDGRTRQRLLALCQPMLRRCGHIVLCDAMRSALLTAWQLPPDQVVVLSNAALVNESISTTADAHEAIEPEREEIRLGFIANLCADKGLWTFLDVVDRLKNEGCAVSALIAGPVEPPDSALEQALRDRLSRMSGVAWLGAVHGDRRAAFYQSVDLLVFPTVYLHESEPLVILEALAHGVPVVTTRRGCIASALADGVVVRALEEAGFVDAAVTAIQNDCHGGPRSADRTTAVAGHYERLRTIGRAQFDVLAERIEARR